MKMFLKNLLLNIFFIFLTFLPSLILNGFTEPYKRGFYCDDETIRKPFLNHEKVNVYLLVFLTIVPSILLISMTNWINHKYYRCKEQEHSALKITLSDIFLLLFGLGCTMILCDTSKYTIGRHRPNFYSACEPKIPIYEKDGTKELFECHKQSSTRYSYIVDYECTKKQNKDIHLSFFSGHSAMMMFSAFFTAIILGQRLRNNLETTLGKLTVVLVIVFHIDLALFVGLTRVSDYKHHPTDVTVGFIVGALMAIFIKLFLDKTKCATVDNELNKNRIQLVENNLAHLV